MQLKTHIEALLFLTDKPLKAQAIARTLNQDVQVVRQAMLELINDYESRNGALEIADEDGYMMQVKDEFSSLVDEFSPFEMPTALVRTLSAIALKQPVSQADVIKIRGAGAYDHIKELEQRELIHKREDGRSPILTTTKKFQEYFRLSKDGQDWRQELSTASKSGKDADGQAEGEGKPEVTAAVQLDVFDASPEAGAEVETDPDLKAEKNLVLDEVYFKEDSEDKQTAAAPIQVESESISR
ncbi:MAG: SMC-Scp complex subunit ScpB [Cyanobacteria bacterium SZAS LIN-3]|nr:SMC-Scp complex subunit ScpB [Cyanobacteria bacterium SZAS LIN-3]MBS2009245.1 SMC-Scp complex subunit ScpB [Cyanobacteria bacterium SZAS TMP-1]